MGTFTSVGSETAEFVPRVAGEYVVDRWAVSGPASVRTDRFIINVEAELAELAIVGPTELSLGQTTEYRVNRDDSVSANNWTLSRPSSMESSFTELQPQADGKAVFIPELVGAYSISCLVVYDTGMTAPTALTVRVVDPE